MLLALAVDNSAPQLYLRFSFIHVNVVNVTDPVTNFDIVSNSNCVANLLILDVVFNFNQQNLSKYLKSILVTQSL